MTDQIPPPPEPLRLPPPPGAFEGAWAAGAAVRRRRLVAAGGVVAAVLGISTVAYSTTFNTASDSLQPAQNGVHGSPLPNPFPSTLPHVSPSPVPGLPSQAGPSQLPGSLPVLPRTASPSPGSGSGEQGSGGGSSRPPSRPMQRNQSSGPYADSQGAGGGSYAVCSATAIRNREPWCGGAREADGPRGDLTLGMDQCRNQSGMQSTLSFATSQEVDIEVLTTSGKRLWRWSDGVKFTKHPHSLSVQPGGCYTWSTTWTPRLPSGEPLPAGDYVIRTHVTATDAAASAPYTATFTY
ncbi:MAG: Intracellular proteinase inhibitor [Actinomycetota bacterium]|nr:Intracellular proteinase inhibitor [Actinomycetota bacterium]